MAANLTFTDYSADKSAYIASSLQMTRYPEAFGAGHCVYRRRANAKGFSYDLKLEDGRVLSGFVRDRELAYGQSIEDYITYVYELNR